MLASADAERLRLFVVTEAEVRTNDPNDRIPACQESVFSYLQQKVPQLPHDLFGLDSYDHDSGVLSTENLETSTLKIWSARLLDPDVTVPGRSWSLELLLGEAAGRVTFMSRLSCFSKNLDFYFEPAVPKVYKDLVSKKILIGDGARLSRWPIEVSSEDDVEWLVQLINNKNRVRDIIAVACDASGACLINPSFFSNRLSSIAHVVQVFPSASYLLSDTIGKYLSVFDSGVRIYRPTAQIESDEPFKHPLFTRSRLQSADRNRLQHTISLNSFRTSAESGLRDRTVPSFVQVRSAKATFRLVETQSSGASVDTVERLRSQLEVAINGKAAAEAQAREALDLAVQEEGTRRQAEEERDQERARAMAIAARVRHLEKSTQGVQQPQLPTQYEDIPGWVEEQFAGRLRLHARALRSLRDAKYENVAAVCELLSLLAVQYVDSKGGDRSAWARFEEGLTARGVQITKSISETRAGEQGDEYFVSQRGRRELLEWHLKKGTSRNPAKDLRIYFFWDDEDGEVVVGYLPGHLDNRFT